MTGSITSAITLSNGLEMPRFGLGVWRVQDEEQLRDAVKAALDAGYIHIDTAAAYRNEDMVGRAVADFAKREDLFITTKLNNRDQVDPERALEDSLNKLGTDYVDLYLIHWPAPKKGLYEAVWKKMVEFYRDGRAKAIGVSNFKAAHIERAAEAGGMMPMVNQVERHPLYQQEETAAWCREKGIVMEAYSPLGSGHLEEMAPALEPIAQKYGKTPAQVILRWHLDTDWVAIPKSVTPSRIVENGGIFDFRLDSADLAAIAKLENGRKFLPDPDEADF